MIEFAWTENKFTIDQEKNLKVQLCSAVALILCEYERSQKRVEVSVPMKGFWPSLSDPRPKASSTQIIQFGPN